MNIFFDYNLFSEHFIKTFERLVRYKRYNCKSVILLLAVIMQRTKQLPADSL